MTRHPPDIRTERLGLRCFTPEDAGFLERLNSDPQVMRFMGGPMSRAQTESMIDERILGYYALHPGLGIWATIARSSGACIGMHALNHVHGEDFVQVGYRLLPAFWGKGYATEMSIALLRYGFGTLGLGRIVAITDPDNAASLRVLAKCGLRRDGLRSFPHPAYARCGPQAWFEREADHWLAEFGR